MHGAQTIALAPLGDSDTAALLGELLGSDPSVGELAAIIAERAAGNPFFAEEMVRELAQRGVLTGERGGYVCRADVADVAVPVTVQAAIEARIDRLDTPAKQTLNAASVIGARFGAELLAALGIDAVFDELLGAELIDQVRFTPSAEYAFHHPLIRAVAYESQLKSDRAQWHRRLAAAIQERDPELGGGERGADRRTSGGRRRTARRLWLAHARRNVGDQPRHRRGATELGARPKDRRRITRRRPRPGSHAHRPPHHAVRDRLASPCERGRRRFEELRELCTAAGDKASLAIGMAGLVIDHAYHDRIREAAQLASEHMALIESIGDPNLTVGLSLPVIYAKTESAEYSDMLRWTQRVIDLADGDPQKATFVIGSPLAFAFTSRAIARYCLGRPGWRRRPAPRPGHGPQRRPVVLRRWSSASATSRNTEWRAEARRFRGARDRGCPADCRTIR